MYEQSDTRRYQTQSPLLQVVNNYSISLFYLCVHCALVNGRRLSASLVNDEEDGNGNGIISKVVL